MNDRKLDLLDELRVDHPSQTIRNKTPWKTYAAGLVMLAALGGYIGWRSLHRPPEVHVAIAQSMPKSGEAAAGSALLDATGYVVARREATVAAKIAGKLNEVLIEEGMRVDAGQIVARLDDSNALAALNQAQAALEQSETTEADARPIFERSKAQLAQGLISRDAFETAKANYDQTRSAALVARKALAVARQNEDDTIVRAPFSGVVTVKAAQAGEIISPLSAGAGFTRTGIATIVDMDSLEVEVDVNENFINRVAADQHCAVTLNAYPDWQIPGHVIAVVPTADRTKATVKVRVAFDLRDSRILPEMGARVTFLSAATPGRIVSETARVIVPNSAIQVEGDGGSVFVVRDGQVERRAVKLGPKTPEGQTVIAGLSSGETVAVGGINQLINGEKVRVAK